MFYKHSHLFKGIDDDLNKIRIYIQQFEPDQVFFIYIIAFAEIQKV